MGLDMFAYKTSKKPISPVHFDVDENDCHQFFYWRKHPNLHGWMENLWRLKGGRGSFNCENLELTLQDLDRLEVEINENNLPSTSGVFFGTSREGEEQIQMDMNFIKQARGCIKNGEIVFYSSWW